MKLKLGLIIALAIIFLTPQLEAVPKSTAQSASVKSSAKSSPAQTKKKAAKKKARRRRRPLESTEARSEKAKTIQSSVPDSVVDALEDEDLNGAILAMREERPSPKLLYLMRETSRISNFLISPKPKRSEAHKTYQNVAIAYHNLYLFLKTKGIEQDNYLKEAFHYYDKARSASNSLHKMDSNLLGAALLAASGSKEEAEKKFSKINIKKMRDDFASTEYLAAYYAAVGDVDRALGALEDAYRINPDMTLTWLAVGDDFGNIKDDPLYQKLMIEWRAAEAEKKLKLTIPKETKSRAEVGDETGSFRPQKTLHHKIKKKRKTAVKKSK